jgi:diguanylate cyclase (GGDEF)-like protein
VQERIQLTPRTAIKAWVASVAAACLGVVLSAALISSLYQTLHHIESVLSDFGYFSIREINIAINDVSYLGHMVALARLAPDRSESAEHLAEATDLVHVRFNRQDQSPRSRDYPEYGAAIERARAVVAELDILLANGPPFPVADLDRLGQELASIQAKMTEAYYASGNATNADLAEIQRRLGVLNVMTAIALSTFAALSIIVGLLLVSRHRTLRAMRHQAWSDSLTGLNNRAWLRANIDQILRRAAAADQEVWLFLIDVDRFKAVNDTFGHHIGDGMLRVVGRVLTAVTDSNAAYALRLGGDEFALLLPDSSNEVFDRVLAELRSGLNAFISAEGVEVHMSATIGVAGFPQHGQSLDALLKNADFALYAAKSQGGGRSVVFSPELNSQIETQLQLDAAIKHAVLYDELFLVWQPQFELASGVMSGAEALVRWRNPATGEVISPAGFIPAAEASELILDIDRFVLAKACRQAAEWSALAPPGFTFSVNLSAKHLQRAELANFVRKTLEESRLDPARLELEITETAFIENRDLAHGVLQQLQALGLRISLDDFGTSYSSLSYLVDLAVTRIKIDRSFMTNLLISGEKQSVVQLIMALAHSLKLDVVAEGVETAEQAAFLLQLGCRYVQGFLLSPPISAQELTGLLSTGNRATPPVIKQAKRIMAA